ncbi:hypothetical protein D9757_002579 [Collybiopsis confluens]|uniref:HMG box domain-containing protein n=1 Tax=Collybiopsis confluens TaxID=2823264 RepID=A0A8H5ME65_9AGAR|nr:hypothetical protein D9757_002579 [Collybiopsis confluens]
MWWTMNQRQGPGTSRMAFAVAYKRYCSFPVGSESPQRASSPLNAAALIMPILQSQEKGSSANSPSLPTIIAPKPLPFTFPAFHNLIPPLDTSSSSSPFEPLLPLARAPPAVTSIVSPSSSSSMNRGSAHLDAGRRPKKGDDDYVKRPENAFILFRRKCCEERQQVQDTLAHTKPPRKQRQADLSKKISHRWKTLSHEERKYWEHLAQQKKREHQQIYPDYVYRPQRVRDQDGRARNKRRTISARARKEGSAGRETTYVVPVPPSIGRSTSEPSLTYQTIHVPNVYADLSHPPSPSPTHMNSQRTAYTTEARGYSDEAGLQANINGKHANPGFIFQYFAQPAEQMPSAINIPAILGGLQGNDQSMWNPTEVWQNEPGMLMHNDFDINAISPVKFTIPEFYPDDGDIFGHNGFGGLDLNF